MQKQVSYGIYFFIISKTIEFIFKYIFIVKRIETVFSFFFSENCDIMDSKHVNRCI